MKTEDQVKVIIATIDNKEHKICVPTSFTGYQLKQHIHKQLCKSLPPLQMHLVYAGVDLKNDKKLSFYKITERGAELKIIQSKLPLSKVAGIIVAYEEDPITCEKQTARMPCGHVIGRNCMTMLVRSLLSVKKYDIKCPSFSPNGDDCEMEWEYKLCRTIGGFTAQQCAEFEEGLSKNWVEKFTVQCPSCHMNLMKESQSAQVVCSRCKYGPFCPICLKKWVNEGQNYCGNMECKMINDFLLNSPLTVKFQLSGKVYNLPRHRACVTCSMLIEYRQGCKHMMCNMCNNQFCWVCLEKPQDGQYQCKSYNDFCGSIAPPQSLK